MLQNVQTCCKNIRIRFRAVVVTNGEEFPGESYRVTKRKISGGKLPRSSLGLFRSAISAHGRLSYHSFTLSWHLKAFYVLNAWNEFNEM